MTITVRGLLNEDMAGLVNKQREERSTEQTQREVYDSHRHRIFSLAFHMTGNELEAEHLLAGTFVRAFLAGPAPDGNDIDAALIAGLGARFSLVPAAGAPFPELSTVSGRNVRRSDLEEAIQKLLPFERLIFLLHDAEGYAVERIAGLVKASPQEISRAVLSARIRLRGILAEIAAERAA